MWLMLQNPEPHNYVIATNRTHTVRDLCAIAFDHAGLNWEDHVEVDDRFKRLVKIEAACGDYSKARTELGWEPRTSFEELVRMMVDADVALVSQ
jgi:GDPmannose 4,6-dehydratase